MKNNKTVYSLKRLGAAIAVLGLVAAVPIVQADDTKAKIKIKGDKIKIKGEDARELLKPEVTASFVDGYTIPNEYHPHFREVPVVEEENLVVRYYGGRAYYVNSNDWTIARVVELDPSIEVSADDAAFVQGYVIPDTYRTRFVEVPNPDAGMSVRYYNNTAYYTDSSHRIVRTVRLVP